MRALKLLSVLLWSVSVCLGADGEGPPYLYLLSEPLVIPTELGPIARTMHVIGETSIQLGKAGLLYMGTHEPYSAMGLLGVELFKMPPMITAQSIADLRIRDWWARRSKMKELDAVPGISSVEIVVIQEPIELKHMIAQRQTTRGMVFIETSKPLPDAYTVPGSGWGKPVLISAPLQTRLRLHLASDEGVHPETWEPTLHDLLAGKPVPPAVAKIWKSEVAAEDAGKNWFQKHFTHPSTANFRIEATLLKPDEAPQALGMLTEGDGTKRMLGETLFGKAKRALTGNIEVRIPVAEREPGESCMTSFLRLFQRH